MSDSLNNNVSYLVAVVLEQKYSVNNLMWKGEGTKPRRKEKGSFDNSINKYSEFLNYFPTS